MDCALAYIERNSYRAYIHIHMANKVERRRAGDFTEASDKRLLLALKSMSALFSTLARLDGQIPTKLGQAKNIYISPMHGLKRSLVEPGGQRNWWPKKLA